MDDLSDRIDEMIRTPVLLVATDFDGTLAPIVSDPAEAEAPRESLVALRAIALLPQTHVAILSGRSLADLNERLGDVRGAHMVGSHGSEFEAGFAQPLPEESLQLLKHADENSRRIAATVAGAMVENKPASIAFHYRNADEAQATAAVAELLRFAAANPSLHLRQGKKVVELSVVKTHKGEALHSLRQRLGTTAVLFFGDDVTDEDAFATLSGPDVGVKVGAGQTAAKYRVQGSMDVARLLATIAEKRAAYLAGSNAVPIEYHSMLSDQRTCALVDPRGRVVWLCLPRIDSPAFFAELIGGPSAGFFEIRPAVETASPRQEYLESSFVLRTDWGGMRTLDYLDCCAGRPFQRAGRTDFFRVIEGQGRARITFAPRLNYGSLETQLRIGESGVTVEGSAEPCILISPGVHWTIQKEGAHESAVAEVDLGSEPVVLELRYGTANMTPGVFPEHARRKQTADFWSRWAATLRLPSVAREQVLRSALVLRALCYGPTGAIAAAATTSLPEHAGGVRNWDYRFCWPRDSAMAASALVRLGASGPAIKLLDWFLGIMESSGHGSMIRPVYTVSGGHLGPEGVIADLAGYLGSRPVRIGNLAAHQIQLDVLGPVAELLALLAHNGASLTPELWRMTESMVAAVDARWKEDDHGIWELRGPRRPNVHSKVMCWQTVDSALKVAAYMGHRHEEWIALRKSIADDILQHGWNKEQSAFCSSYDSNEIDAASLCVGLSGLLPPDDPRFAGTVAAVERVLRDGPTVYRYKYDDGLPGKEGGFNICTSWLIESYTLLGRWRDAEELFKHYLALAGPTGLIAEEFDPKEKRALGNFPQAYSHIGLINAALRLDAHRQG